MMRKYMDGSSDIRYIEANVYTVEYPANQEAMPTIYIYRYIYAGCPILALV